MANEMNFELPPSPSDISTQLRELEASAPPQTAKNIRAALIQAAQEIESLQSIAQHSANVIEEAANVRVSQMASTSRVEEIQRGVQLTLLEVARRLREGR